MLEISEPYHLQNKVVIYFHRISSLTLVPMISLAFNTLHGIEESFFNVNYCYKHWVSYFLYLSKLNEEVEKQVNLNEIKGSYDAIFSLGNLCLTSIQLKKHNLRPYSGVLDWVASPDLSKVINLLENRFIGFLDYENLRVLGYADKYICVSDDGYRIVSNHDFGIDENTLENLWSYHEVMKKYNRRIKRFLEEMNQAKNILFVRTEATFEEVSKLHEVLSDLVAHDFKILIVNHTDTQELVEKNWPLDKVCAVELPNEDIWEGNHSLWEDMLNGITLNKK